MQNKVSMVMPCYNKEDDIGDMFDSILAQNWNNIELILVNDGSTDKTRDIIGEYEVKFKKRGYEVVIVDQENAGVCAAGKAGLERVTGDYVCMVDADDELSPVYVSTMAGWLEFDKHCDYVVCGGINYTGYKDKKAFTPDWFAGKHYYDEYLVERYILGSLRTTPWIYMIRKEYLIKCNIIKFYFTDTKGSHEPSYIIPILSYGGRYKYLHLPLYHFNINGESHSRSNEFERIEQYIDVYAMLCKIAIDNLPEKIMDSKKKKKMIDIAKIVSSIKKYQLIKQYKKSEDQTRQIMNTLLGSVNSFFKFEQPITLDQTSNREKIFLQSLTAILTGCKLPGEEWQENSGRIIGYGSMGKMAAYLIPQLKGTKLEPTEYWDMHGDGKEVKKPEFNTIEDNDLIIVFPIGNVFEDVSCEVMNKGCKVMKLDDINIVTDVQKFPQLISLIKPHDAI